MARPLQAVSVVLMRLLAPGSLVSRLMLLQFQNGLSPGSTTGLSGPWVMMRRRLTVG